MPLRFANFLQGLSFSPRRGSPILAQRNALGKNSSFPQSPERAARSVWLFFSFKFPLATPGFRAAPLGLCGFYVPITQRGALG